MIRRFLLYLALAVGVSTASATTVTGTAKVNGTPFTGYVTFQLNYPASTGSYINLPQPTAPILVSNGQFASLALDGNDTMLPKGSYYAVRYYDVYGNVISRLNYVITGANFDLGAAVPTPVTTNNVSFLDLLGLRSLSVQNLTVNNQTQIGTGTIVSQSGVSNAETIMNVEFAAAFNTQNPSSTTCGIQEAENALPTQGGTIVLQSGSCNVSTTIILTKPTTLMGLGVGGYSNSALTSYLFPTTLNMTGTGPLVSVLPAAGTTLSGVIVSGTNLSGVSGSGALLQIGNASSTTAYVRNVVIKDAWVGLGGSSGISVVGNVDSLEITNTILSGNTGSGLDISAGAGYVVSGVNLSHVNTQYNGVDGVLVNAVGVGGVSLLDTHADHNTANGLAIGAAATSATVSVLHSSFSSNSGNGVLAAAGSFSAYQSAASSNAGVGMLFSAGSGHILDGDTITSNSGGGVDVTTAGATGVQVLSVKDGLYSPANTGFDIANISTAYVLLYPQITQAEVTSGSFNNISIGAAVSRVCNTNGCYRVELDGTIEQWGQSANAPGTGSAVSLAVTFPTIFTTTTDLHIEATPIGSPGGDGSPHPLDCHVVSFTTSGATVVLAIPQQIGGSGYSSPILASEYCDVYAWGH